jgi:hypothetical protein
VFKVYKDDLKEWATGDKREEVSEGGGVDSSIAYFPTCSLACIAQGYRAPSTSCRFGMMM